MINNKTGGVYWINLSKVIGIYLMILGHRCLVDSFFTQIIFSFHMPLFFIMSGMLYHPKPFRETLDKVLRSLLIPFIIMTLFWIIYYFLCAIKNNLAFSEIWSHVIGSIISPGHEFLIFTPLCVYLWFIMALAIIKIMVSLVRCKMGIVAMSVLGILADVILTKYNVLLPFALNSVLLALPFFSIGYVFSQFFRNKFTSIIETCLLIVGVAIVMFIGAYNGRVDINNNLYGNNIILYLICGTAGSLVVFSLSKLLTVLIPYESKVINVLSKGTLLMVGFSATLTAIYIYAIDKFLTIHMNSNLIGMVIGIFVLMSFYPLTLFANRYFPAIIGYRK